MAVDFSVPAPVEPEKQGDYLHDRSRLPEAPARPQWRRAEDIFGLVSLIATIALTVVALQTWDAWDNTRDLGFVISVGIVALGGVGLGYLLWRQRWDWAGPSLIIGFLIALVIGANLWRASYVDGSDTLRDVLSIVTGILGGLLIGIVVFGYFWVEITDPTRAPEPEM